jgi:hypothetical protein
MAKARKRAAKKRAPVRKAARRKAPAKRKAARRSPAAASAAATTPALRPVVIPGAWPFPMGPAKP